MYVCVCVFFFCDLPEPRTPIIDNSLYLSGDVPYWRLEPVKSHISIVCCMGRESLGFRASSGVFFLSPAFLNLVQQIMHSFSLHGVMCSGSAG